MSDFFFAFSVALGAMFPIINPIGHAPIFFMMTGDDAPSVRHRQAAMTSLYVFLILAISLFLGRFILGAFSITLDDLRIAGGILIGATAWNMLQNTSRITESENMAGEAKADISLTPMAMPILSGPGAMSLAVGMSHYGSAPVHYMGYVAGFFAVAAITWVSLRFAEHLVRIIGTTGIGALNRLLGFLILAIGVDLIVDGIRGVAGGSGL